MIRSLSVLFLSELCQGKPVLYATAALENVLVIRIRIALTNDICAAQLELLGQGGFTSPLHIS